MRVKGLGQSIIYCLTVYVTRKNWTSESTDRPKKKRVLIKHLSPYLQRLG